MDGSGIDFVEADFGQEAAAGGAARFTKMTQKDWHKWSNAKSRNPIYPLFLGVIFFVVAICSPWILDCIQSEMLSEQAAKIERENQINGVVPQQNSAAAQMPGHYEGFFNRQAQIETQPAQPAPVQPYAQVQPASYQQSYDYAQPYAQVQPQQQYLPVYNQQGMPTRMRVVADR